MKEKIEDILREMRSAGDYPTYRKPVFSSPKFVSPSYINDFMRGPDGFLYFGETIFAEEPRVVEVHVYELAERIENAVKQLKAENAWLKDEIKCKTQNYETVIRAKDQELERLRAALKPVLEVEWHKDWNGPNGYTVYGVPLPSLAVKEAQKIYKEVANV